MNNTIRAKERSELAIPARLVNDGDGNRVAETVGGTTTKYLVDAVNPTGYAQVIDELVSGAVTRTYAYGLQRISENQKIGTAQTVSFYGYDGHGNVRFLTGTAGTATDTYVYDAFGLPLTTTGTTPNNFLYSGEQFDSTLGMYYLRARYYNPATGRFLTTDTYLGTILDPATLHRYVYARNNPVNRIDPSGWDSIGEEAELSEVNITFGHGARHLLGTGLSQAEAEAAIEQAAREWLANNAELPQYFFAQLEVRGVSLILRAFFVTDVWLHIGTYYPIGQ